MQDQYPEILVLFIGSIFIALLLIAFIIFIVTLYNRKKLLQEKEMQNMKTAYEKEMLQTRLEIQETVLKNVAMEIHDNIGQIMLLANVNMTIVQSMPLPPEAPQLIKDTKAMLSQASQDISQLSKNLHTDRITDLGVFEAILYELSQMGKRGLFKIQLEDEYHANGKSLSKETQILVFRMFQEIFNNIIKHAKATLVKVVIRPGKDGIELEITDNGIGFPGSPTGGQESSHNGIGMRSLQSRADLFKGRLTIQSELQKGTTICIFIPV
jgi:two-component system NarL family sensor kinase